MLTVKFTVIDGGSGKVISMVIGGIEMLMSPKDVKTEMLLGTEMKIDWLKSMLWNEKPLMSGVSMFTIVVGDTKLGTRASGIAGTSGMLISGQTRPGISGISAIDCA